MSTLVKWKNKFNMCYRLTGKDSGTGLFQMGGER